MALLKEKCSLSQNSAAALSLFSQMKTKNKRRKKEMNLSHSLTAQHGHIQTFLRGFNDINFQMR